MELLGPFHPQIVHFPIALLVLSVVFDLVGRATDTDWWRKASLAMLTIAVIVGVAAILTGEFVGDKAEHLQRIPEATVDAHGDVGKIAIWLAGGALLARWIESGVGAARGIVSGVALLLQLAAAITIGVAAHRGGKLVYRHGAGVSIDGQLIQSPSDTFGSPGAKQPDSTQS